jgi:hypothetical protein
MRMNTKTGSRSRTDAAVDDVLGVAAVAPPAFWLGVLSTPRLKVHPPSYAELYTAYRFRRALPAAGALAGLALLRRSRGDTGAPALRRWTLRALAGMAGISPLVYDPLLFAPRRTDVRVRPATDAGDVFVGDDTEVFGVEFGGEARAYPARHAARPHVIADTIAGQPIVVSYCGLTNSAIVYLADSLSQELAVVSAPNNNILYWDAATDSLVQQLLPVRVHGPAAGRPLRTIPITYTTWEVWQRLAPHTTIADPGWASVRDRLITRTMRGIHARVRVKDAPFLAVAGGADDTVHPKARVFALSHDGDSRAYTRGFLAEHGAVNHEVAGRPVVVLYDPRTNVAAAYWREIDGHTVVLEPAGDGTFHDPEMATRWDLLGRPLGGGGDRRRLEPVAFSFDKVFWFAWRHFHPDTALHRQPGERDEPETPRLAPGGSMDRPGAHLEPASWSVSG